MAEERLPVTQEARGEVLLLTIANPPVNAIGVGVPRGLIQGLERAQAEEQFSAVVICGAGRGIIAGADIRSFGKPWPEGEPKLWDLIAALEASKLPVVALLRDHCLGGGLELAMACHYRAIAPGCKVGQPEVKLGIPPGGGGTQRLPRLAGAEKALEMILNGDPIGAEAAVQHGIADRLLGEDPEEEAIAFAKEVAGADLPLTRNKQVVMEDPDIFQKTRDKIARRAKGQRAPFACIDCVEAATTMAFDDGIAFERRIFEECRDSAEGAALRHVFFAERSVRKVPGISRETERPKIESAAVIGAGTMGGGISMCFANAGIPVTIIEREQEALDRGLGRIRANYETSVKRGRISEAELDQAMALITPALSFDAASEADMVIEAVFEEMPVKEEVFRQLDQVCKADAILASNTSYLNVDHLVEIVPGRRGRLLGTHFFSPANVMRLLEVVRTETVTLEVLAAVLDLGRKLGKLPVVSGVCHGFIGNRMLEGYFREAHFLIEEGASPAAVDKVMTDYGMAMGPFAVMDLAGLDIGWAKRKANAHLVDPAQRRECLTSDRLCERGWYGQKTGRGYYRYEPGKRGGSPDPEVEALIAETAAELGVARREIGEEEILERCLLPLVYEGARVLEEGIALRASDIDLVWLNGYAYPRWRGGPLCWADSVGLDKVAEKIRRYGEQAGPSVPGWSLAPLLEDLAASGRSFADFDSEKGA